jgi:hypothetical protein
MKDEFSAWCCRINVFSQRDKIDTLIFEEVEGQPQGSELLFLPLAIPLAYLSLLSEIGGSCQLWRLSPLFNWIKMRRLYAGNQRAYCIPRLSIYQAEFFLLTNEEQSQR